MQAAAAPRRRPQPRGSARNSSTPPVEPPSDDELVWYLGPQRRWVHVATLASFLFAGWSLVQFCNQALWLLPMLGGLAVSLAASVLSLIAGMNRKRDTLASHLGTIAKWEQSTPIHGYSSVDVFLPSAGEDQDVLRNTYFHVSRMEWPGTLDVWVLDDADLPRVADLAEEFGFHYRVRDDRGRMKKAGNLQYGFGETSGDYIVIFDADFVPRVDFLHHTVPYLVADESIAILQTPQFFNTGGRRNWLERTAGATQELFYRWTQPSRDRVGAAICVGTCAVYRRSALETTGGFAQIEHSEDVHTGMMLLRAGYRLRYVPVLVSKGLCPTDLAGFLNQQYRWCNGSITLLRSGQASQRPLTVRQRLAFWSGFLYYISTALNVFLLHVPGIVMVLFFAGEVREANFIPFLAGLWIYLVLFPAVSKSRWRFEVMRVQMAYSFSHALAITHKLTGRTKGWVATGAVSKKSSLARTISMIGLVEIVLSLGLLWFGLIRSIVVYGPHQFWPMAILLAGYTYVGAPLARDFVRILVARGTPDRASATPEPNAPLALPSNVSVWPLDPILAGRA